MKTTAGILVVCMALFGVTSSTDSNYHTTCLSDLNVGVQNRRPGKVKGHGRGSSNRQCRFACTRDYTPVCGSDGTTYGNECSLCASACKDHALYLACSGECPCTVPSGSQHRGDPGVVSDADTAGNTGGALPQNVAEQDRPRDRPRANQGGPRQLKKNPNPVIIITNIELNIRSDAVIADTLNHLTLDLHAEIAPESNPVSQSSLWKVELYYRGRGKSRNGLVRQALSHAQSDASLELGQSINIRGIDYELDLRGKTCSAVREICTLMKHQKTGGRRAKVIGKPTKKSLRHCTKVKCKSAA